MGSGRRVDVGRDERLLDHFSAVDVLESGDLLSDSVVSHVLEFPAEVHFDSSLVSLVKHHFVHVGELGDHFVRRPILDFS